MQLHTHYQPGGCWFDSVHSAGSKVNRKGGTTLRQWHAWLQQHIEQKVWAEIKQVWSKSDILEHNWLVLLLDQCQKCDIGAQSLAIFGFTMYARWSLPTIDRKLWWWVSIRGQEVLCDRARPGWRGPVASLSSWWWNTLAKGPHKHCKECSQVHNIWLH